jgi:hypothetical protein
VITGIITKAQEGNLKNGMVALEEFLQQKYIENYDKISDSDSKIVRAYEFISGMLLYTSK